MDTGTDRAAWRSRGYVPHFDAPELVQHVTFRLSDSLPKSALEEIERELRDPGSQRLVERQQRIQVLLDASHGSCVLGRSEIAQVVEESLLFGDETRYRLLDWCVMPNHVHVLIGNRRAWTLSKVVQGWKRHTSREIHRLDGSVVSPLWQREYWDRFVRSEYHLGIVREYIRLNPVKAGLVKRAEDWRWGSAWHRGNEEGSD